MMITRLLLLLFAVLPAFVFSQQTELRTVNENNLRSVLQRYPANAVQYVPIGQWDVSRVTDFSGLFVQRSDFNDDISTWDTSSATNMAFMFEGCEQFNQDLSNWDVSRVRDMGSTFTRARSFNGDISTWDVGTVVNMAGILSACSAFNQDISSWNVGMVETFSNAFASASVFNSDLSQWDVSNVANFEAMFFQATEFVSDLSGWATSSATTMDRMFFGARAFNSNLNGWDTSSVENMFNMFRRAVSFSQTLCWDLSSIMPTRSGESGVFEAFASSGGASFNQFCTNAADNEFYSNNDFRDDSASDLDRYGSATAQPTTSPTPAPVAPTAAPTTPEPVECPSGSFFLGDELGCACFSGNTIVDTQDKGSISMRDLKIGDKVHVGSEKFETVYSFGHYNPLKGGEYLVLNNDLEISPTHMIAEATRGFVPASTIKVGDNLVMGSDASHVQVFSVTTTTASDMFAPFTPSGKIVVNGVIASTFITMQADSSVLKIGGFSTGLHWHFLARTFEVPHRVICSIIGGCDGELYTAEGISEWVAGPRQLAIWLNEQSVLVSGAVWLPILGLVTLFAATEAVLATYCGAVVTCVALVAMKLKLMSKSKVL